MVITRPACLPFSSKSRRNEVSSPGKPPGRTAAGCAEAGDPRQDAPSEAFAVRREGAPLRDEHPKNARNPRPRGRTACAARPAMRTWVIDGNAEVQSRKYDAQRASRI